MARKTSHPVFSSQPSQSVQTKPGKRKTKKSAKRTLDAFAIASAETPEKSSVRASRLGQREDSPAGARKRRRQTEDEDDEAEGDGSEQQTEKSRKRQAKDKSKDGDISEGSDSEGNNWRLGHVDEDDDTEVDSDEAFDDDDEERFSGWTFGASSTSNKNGKGGKVRTSKYDGKAGNELDEDDEDDDSSLGEDAVDLAQMLDDYEPSDEEVNETRDESQSSEGDSGSEEESHFSGFSEEEEDDDVDMKEDQLQKLISDIHPRNKQKSSSTTHLYDSTTPTAAGPTTVEKFDINSLLTSTSDPNLASLIKKVGNVPKELKKDPKLAPSIPKREKDKLERIAASKLTEKQLERWVDSVKQIRRAEHLTFPLVDPETTPLPGSEYIMPEIAGKPINDLEVAMNSILQESGLAANDEEEENDGFDELPENNVTIDEILAKRADLRRARELMYQEEKRSKRIKKIKSKTYRRIHRKERQRRLADMEALEDDGSSMDEEEKEEHDRKRAEDRMNTKHRDSKWAKQMKKSGRTVWDDDVKSGVVDLARRNEELKRRIAGKNANDSDDSPSSEDESADEGFKLRSLNDKLDTLMVEPNDKEGRLASMAFMKKAAQARKAQNDAAVRRMKKDLAGESSSEAESGDENIGRKIFGPQTGALLVEEEVRNEFEAPDESDVEDHDAAAPIVDPTVLSNTAVSSTAVQKPRSKARNGAPASNVSLATQNIKASTVERLPGEIHSAPNVDGWVTVSYEKPTNGKKSGVDDDDDAASDISQSSIFQRAFAGDDDLEAQFTTEKTEVVHSEDEKFEDDTLAGWGTWVGEGLSSRERKRDQATLKRRREKLVRRKEEGIKPKDRKDAHLANVIISQKRIKSNAGYLATQLPFPFKTRAEYERSIRMPVGGEWNVTRSFQENTKPRVMVKQGRVVEPMDRPIA
jgi:U3 small nucleolar RNA-associated protein 14